MPKYMPSRSDLKQGMTSLGRKGRPRTKFSKEEDPMVSSGLKPAMPFKEGGLSWGAKTGIEEKAADDAFRKQYFKSGPAQGPADDVAYQRVISDAKREARDEIRRETKGKAPKAYANGGSASSRADGIAQRGKTKGRVL